MIAPPVPAPDAVPPSPAWSCVDSHAHLSMDVFADDLGALLLRARSAGIAEVLTAATSLRDAERNIEIASRTDGPALWAAVGFHPHQAREWRDGDEATLEALLARERVVAVGETGLDYHYDLSPRDVQREVFARQVALARRIGRPIVVHCRKAAPDILAILESEGARDAGGVLHCFTEDAAFARRCLDLGLYISFAGILTFKRSGDLRDVARLVPEDRLLVETDAPYLAPEPHRGRRNEPARAAEILLALATLRGAEPAALGGVIGANFRRLFGGDGT